MYKEINGTSYHAQTPIEVCNVLERVMKSRTRIRIDLGYTESTSNEIPKNKGVGHSWGEIYDVTGYVGKSTGKIKIPLLVHNSRSMGGGSILDHCIVQIKESRGGRVLYQHPNYVPYKEDKI